MHKCVLTNEDRHLGMSPPFSDNTLNRHYEIQTARSQNSTIWAEMVRKLRNVSHWCTRPSLNAGDRTTPYYEIGPRPTLSRNNHIIHRSGTGTGTGKEIIEDITGIIEDNGYLSLSPSSVYSTWHSIETHCSEYHSLSPYRAVCLSH